MQAKWWSFNPTNKEQIQCSLCSHACKLALNQWGFCKARRYSSQGLESPFLGKFSVIGIDPIEKKPLRHFFPGSQILSLGSLGCTMSCLFCQNYSIARITEDFNLQNVSIEALIDILHKQRLQLLAYTYNEPLLQAEYILAAGPMLRANNIKTVIVSNGNISQGALEELLPFIDAANIDIKTFSKLNYAKLGGSLETSLGTIRELVNAGKHVEITSLIVPKISDNIQEFEAMLAWIAKLSPNIPLHVAQYFPAYKYKETSVDKSYLQTLHDLAKKYLNNVYIGNV